MRKHLLLATALVILLIAAPYPGTSMYCHHSTYQTQMSTAGMNGFPVTPNSQYNIGFEEIAVLTPMSGTYYIGGMNPDFTTINSAITALFISGVTGPVNFYIAPGTYTEQLSFVGIPTGVSSINNVTFSSLGNDSTSVVIQYSASISTSNWVILFDNASYFTFKHLSIKALGSSYGRVIDIRNGSNNISILNCIVTADVTGTNTNFSIIYCETTSQGCDYIEISNNHISKGYDGIFWNGSSSSRMTHFVVENNIIDDFYYFGIRCSYVDSAFIRNNSIVSSSSTSFNTGIRFNYGSGHSEIVGNKILMLGSSTQTGLYIGYHSTSDTLHKLLIANNFIMQTGSNSGARGIHLLSANHVNIYHNSISITSTSTFGRALFASGGSNLRIINNSLANFGNGHAYYTSSTSNIINSDYNNLYTLGANLAYWGNNRIDLAALQTASGKELNSVSLDPQYTSVVDLHSNALGMFQAGTPLAEVPFDIDGEPRNPIAPCIGADEFFLTSIDAAITDFSHDAPYCSGQAAIKLVIKNFGTQAFTGAEIHWWVNEMPQPTYIFSGTVNPGMDQEVLVDTLAMIPDSTYHFVFCIANPGGNPDPNPLNDTLKVFGIRTGLSGTYTVGPDSTESFPTIKEAIEALRINGVCGPVTINLTSNMSPVYGSINFEGIKGSTAINTILINGNGNTIIASDSAYIMRFGGNSYITLDGFRLIADPAATAKMGILITNGSNHLSFTNNFIDAGIASTSNTSAGIAITGSETHPNGSGDNAANITIDSNTITGGYYGISIFGGSSYNFKQNYYISNNNIRDFRMYGMILNQIDSVIVTQNDISRPAGSNPTSFFGLSAAGIRYSKITKNRIHSSGVGDYHARPIYLIGSANAIGVETEISNNLIYNIPTIGETSGISLANVDYVNVYHNTVHLASDNSGTRRGIRLGAVCNNTNIKNNIISIDGVSLGINHAIYVTHISQMMDINNNIYHLSTLGNNNYIGRWVTTHLNSMADWQNNTGKDSASLAANPIFSSPVTGDFTPLNIVVNNTGTPTGVMVDINNTPRSLASPDAGAIEHAGITEDIGILGASHISDPCPGVSDSLMILIENKTGQTKQFAINPLTINWQYMGPVVFSGSFTLQNGSLALGDKKLIRIPGANISEPGKYELRVWISQNTVNQYRGNDTIIEAHNFEVMSPIRITSEVVLVTDTLTSVLLQTKSPFYPKEALFFTEICQYRSQIGQPAGGWPTYFLANDYVEITGIPNKDLAGYTLEQWYGPNLMSTHTFPSNTLLSPNGTAMVVVGPPGSSVPVPSSYYYHGNGDFSSLISSLTVIGRVLKDPDGKIMDAVGYQEYYFPPQARVPLKEWSSPVSGTPSYSGIRLIGPDNNNGDNWVIVNAQILQDPNVLNAGVTAPSLQPLSGLSWHHNGLTYPATLPDTVVGPWNSNGTYQYIAIMDNACGLFYDTISIVVNLNPIDMHSDTTICAGDTALIQTWLHGVGPYSLVWSDGTTTDTVYGISGSYYPLYVTPNTTTVYSILAFADSAGVFIPVYDSVTVTVNQLPSVTFSSLPSICENDTSLMLTGLVHPVGGLFDGVGVSGDYFDPFVAGVGSHPISYTYTDGNGCSNHVTQIIDVHPLPTLAIVGLNPDYCDGNSPVTLTGHPAGGGFSGQGVVGDIFDPTIAGTGVHTITYSYTDSLGCSSSISDTTEVFALPVVSISGASDTICLQNDLILDAGYGFSSYLWNTYSINQSILVTGASIGAGNTGTYSVTVTNSSGCENSATVSIDVVDCSNILNLALDQSVVYWPNPGSDKLFVRIDGVNDNVLIEIISGTGELVVFGNYQIANGNPIEINTSNLSGGLYFLKIATTKQMVIKKLMILRN